MVLEQFKNIIPERIATYINEQKVKTAAEAAVLADEFVLIHKNSNDYQKENNPRLEREDNGLKVQNPLAFWISIL